MATTKMIGNKIAEARKKATISQAQLAQRLFISSQAVGKWERGESMPDITTFERLAEILGVDLNYFSEVFPTASDEKTAVEPMEKQSVKKTSGEPNQANKGSKKPIWDMSRGNWVDADFSGLKNLHDKFSSSNMQRCKFIGSDLSGLLLKNNNVDACDFTGSDLSHSHIQNSNLAENLFNICSINETKFSRTNINGCDFSDANVSGSEFTESFIYGCNCRGANFTGVTIKSGGFSGVASKSESVEKDNLANVILHRTSFIDAQLADLVFTGLIDDCYFENCAFTRVTFKNATLINTFFKNKTMKRIKFIDSKADRMTYEFLKNGKADLSGITQLPSDEENEGF
jgi:uncharacterized protein YjbI with pentapeptide repeats